MSYEPDINEMDDPDKIRKLMANALRLGRDDLAWECKIRVATLASSDHDDPLEKEFWLAVHTAEEIKTEANGRTTKLSRTRQKYTKDGAYGCIKDLATKKTFSDGFEILASNGRLDLTFEAILLRNSAHFIDTDVESVKAKLLGVDVSQQEIEGWLYVQG